MPPPAAPTSTKEQVGAALQTAGQYAGGSTIWTPGNAEALGLDPERGYIAKGTPTDQPQPTVEQLRQELQQGGALPKPVTPTTHPGLHGFTNGEQAAPPPQSRQPGPVPSPLPEPPPEPPVSTSGESDLKGAISEEEHAKEEKKGKTATSQLEGAVSEEEHAKEGKSPPQLEGAVSEEEHAKEAPAPSIPQKPGETAPTAAAPVQAAAPPAPATPMPSGTGAGAPQGAPALIPGRDAHINALIASGKTPGEAQATADGEAPKTLTGETPPPKPAPAPKTEQPQPPQGETIDWGRLGYKSFEDYQKFVNELGVHTAVKGPGTTAILTEKEQTPPTTEAKPSTTAPSTTTKDEKPAVIDKNRLYGTATSFGLNPDGSIDADDNGIGFFGGVNTRNPHLRAVAVPVDVLEGIFGKFTRKNAQGGYDALDTPEAKAIIANIRSAHVELPDPKGKMHHFPIVDIQGSLGRHPGKVLDLTFGAMKELGFTDNHAVSYQIIGGDGKPYPIPDIELTRGGKDGGPAAGPAVGPGGPAGPWISVGGAPSGGGAAPEQFRAPSEGGGGGAQPDYSPSESRAEPMSLAGLGALLTGAAAGAALRGGPQATQPSEEKGPSPSDVVAKVLAAGGPPPAPGAATVDLSTMKPANVLSVRNVGAPQLGLPAPPAAPSAAAAPDPSVIKGLMKAGFTLEQANAFAAKARVSKPGAAAIAGAASFRKPAQLPAPPAAPARQLPVAAAKPPLQPPPTPQAPPLRQATSIGPKGSTVGIPNPPGSEAIAKWPRLTQQLQQHAAILSPDDPRVKKQADNMTKGEHFVPGDPMHEQLLGGLPNGHGGRQRQILAQAEQAIAEKRPMHVSYISAPKEAAKFPTRESRTVQYDEHSPEARLMGTTEGQLVGHSFIPVSVGISPSSKAGEPHQSYIQGISTNILANNFQHVNDKLAGMGRKTPYQKLGQKFFNDLEGYYSNLNAGHTATGRGYVVGTEDHPAEPDRSHVPYKLSRAEADFIGTVINNTAAFAGHEDAKKLRELARVNGTLITEKGETNRLRHEIEQHEPGWRQRVLEPSIRSFKTGLVHEVHPTEEYMPATIRPGKEFQDFTRAIARTSERGRPDVPISVSLHHTLQDNKIINQIERDFSEERINEAEARARLHALGEDPDEYKFVSGSGGLVSPYEDDGEQITPQEHSELKSNLRKQWIGGKMPIEDYRRKVAEVPLPTKPSTPEEGQGEPGESPSSPVPAGPLQSGSVAAMPRPGYPSRQKSTTASSLKSLASSSQPETEEPETHEETPPTPPAPKRPLKAPKEPPAAPTAPPESAAAPPPKSKEPETKEPPTYKEMSPAEQDTYVAGRVKDRLANQIKGAVKLRPQLEEDGSYARDEAGNPQWEKGNYDLVNSPILGAKRLDRAKDQKFKDQADIYGQNEHTHLNQIDRKRLSYLEQKSAVDTMADKIVNAYHGQMSGVPEVMAAKGWYTNMQKKLKAAFGPDAEIFAQLLGATSARTGVQQNFIQSLDAYDQLKNGNFDNHIQKYLEAHQHLANGEGALAKHMHESGIIQQMLAKGQLPKGVPKTDAAAMAAWIAHHDILPRQKNGQKFNANSNQVLKVLAQKWLQNVKAPKTPNFAGNLSGRTREATIDVWAARFLHELGNEGNKKPWMLQPGGESGVRGLDFSFSQRAMRKAADRIGVSPDDLQAIAWYHQKHLWDARGHTKGQGAKKASFDQTFDRIFSPTGERLSDEEARKAFAGEKEELPEEEQEAA